MKVFYNGFNAHRQLPCSENVVKNFMVHVYEDVRKIEVSYYFAVLLVADRVICKGAKNGTFQFEGRISQISCQDDTVLTLMENGDLIKISDAPVKVPNFIESGDCVKKIAQGDKLSVALTKKGFLYNIPNRLEFTGSRIVDVRAGREHCIVLDTEGNVYSFGCGSRGQLGHGSLDDETEPGVIDALRGIKIKSIDAGGWHSCAVSEEGDLYTWGWNGNGQLGLFDEGGIAVMATPQVVELECNVEMVGCGTRHTVILTDKRELLGCGWNKYKQLKNDASETFHNMTFLDNFGEERVERLTCGPWNTLVVCESVK